MKTDALMLSVGLELWNKHHWQQLISLLINPLVPNLSVGWSTTLVQTGFP